jgi:hypothetical protein
MEICTFSRWQMTSYSLCQSQIMFRAEEGGLKSIYVVRSMKRVKIMRVTQSAYNTFSRCKPSDFLYKVPTTEFSLLHMVISKTQEVS